MNIREYKSSDLIEVSKLSQRTYANFNKNEGSKEAVQDYINWYSSSKENISNVKDSYSKTPLFFVAVENQQIIGIIHRTAGHHFHVALGDEHIIAPVILHVAELHMPTG